MLVCNLPAHYEQGMHAAFTVSVNLSLFLRDTVTRRLPATLREKHCSPVVLRELTALNLQSIFRSGPALAAGSGRKRYEARSLGTTA